MAEDGGRIICIDLILLMGCTDPPKLLCNFSYMLNNVSNTLVDTSFPAPRYVTITEILNIGMDPSHTPDSLTHIYCYMYDAITEFQGGL